jgi:hypothetical protein
MQQLTAICLLLTIITAVGCSSTKVLEYDGAKVIRGTGGAKEVIDGVDFWKVGTPNGDYKIVGIVEDEYLENGSPLGSLMAGTSSRSRIVKAAKSKGANGVILISKDRSDTGISGNINSFGQFNANRKSKVAQQYALIIYVK